MHGEGRKVWICTPAAPFLDWNEELIAREARRAA
jgi:hypothetical protein